MRTWCRAALPLLLALALMRDGGAAPAVRVQPSGDSVPANLLRISLAFAAPVDGPVLPRIALLRPDGTPLPAPFLEQELWSPDGKILTILLHPGRVKTGLVAHDTLGPVLAEGEFVTLALDGRPLRRWRVGAIDRDGPAPAAWRLSAVQAGTRRALVVTLDDPVDGRDAGYLAVADARGRRVAGRASLLDGERTWTFIPARPWQAGSYRLLARGPLEDAAGNRLNGHFETATAAPATMAADAGRDFTVTPRPAVPRSGIRAAAH